MYSTVDEAVCLRAQGIDDNNSGAGGGRQDQELSNNDRGVGRGQRIDNAVRRISENDGGGGGSTMVPRNL